MHFELDSSKAAPERKVFRDCPLQNMGNVRRPFFLTENGSLVWGEQDSLLFDNGGRTGSICTKLAEM